ncbi:MAG: branched-chain amino acid ABC transporter permease [Pararhodobacter sp.]|nr:branched-chain amino acid ABC transporter permease [Pararhodobacter sp.]
MLRALVGGLVVALPVLVIALGIDLLAPGHYRHMASIAMINLMIVLGLQVYMGNSGIVHLGHSAFVGLGAYGVAILATPVAMKALSIPDAPLGLAQVQLHPLGAALAALAVVGVIALLTGLIIARLSGVAATIVSLAFLIVCHGMFLNWPALFKGNQAFFGIPREIGFWGVAAAAAGTVVLARLFRESRTGMQLRASAQDMQAARALGLDVTRLRRRAWILSALICGGAGVMFAYLTGTISPRAFYFQQVFLTLAMLILGGMATVTGAVLGTLLLSVGLEVIRRAESGLDLGFVALPQMLGLSGVALGIVIVLGMALRPQGLAGRLELDEYIATTLRRGRSTAAPGTAQGEREK